jgi:hypothetical protein
MGEQYLISIKIYLNIFRYITILLWEIFLSKKIVKEVPFT